VERFFKHAFMGIEEHLLALGIRHPMLEEVLVPVAAIPFEFQGDFKKLQGRFP